MPRSTFLNGRHPTQLRGLAWLSLSESGNVHARTTTSDAGGGATYTWVAGSAVPCRLDPIGDRNDSRVVGGRIDERSTHVVTVPSGTSVPSSSRFSVTGRGTFEVTAVRDRTAEFTHTFEVVQI
jgi:hypothetical protein